MEELWCVHIEGPDDILPMPSKGEAEKEAAVLNAIAARELEAHGDDIIFRAAVVHYPYSAESHAEGCADRAEEEMLRKLQPDTLRLIFKDLRGGVDRLTAENSKLRSALTVHGRHGQWCGGKYFEDHMGHCDCGLARALADVARPAKTI